MKTKYIKTIGNLCKAPLIVLVVIAFIASIYASYNNMMNITYGSTVVLGLVLIAYVIGEILLHRKPKGE